MTKIYVPIVDKLSIPLKHRKAVETECEKYYQKKN